MVDVVRSAFKSIVVVGEDGQEIRLNENDEIVFALEMTGEARRGTIIKISGKDAKTKLQIRTKGTEFEEIHNLVSIAEGTLKLATDDEE